MDNTLFSEIKYQRIQYILLLKYTIPAMELLQVTLLVFEVFLLKRKSNNNNDNNNDNGNHWEGNFGLQIQCYVSNFCYSTLDGAPHHHK